MRKLMRRGNNMSNMLNDHKKWTDLKEYLEVYGDFVFQNPRLTDEVMAEFEVEYKCPVCGTVFSYMDGV